MKNADLSQFQPQRDVVYYAAMAAPPNGAGCGVVIVSAGVPRLACHGADSDPGDGYKGDVLLNTDGQPLPGAVVQYFRAAEVMTNSNSATVEASTHTGVDGRHCVYLEPGVYMYRQIAGPGAKAMRAANAPEYTRIEVSSMSHSVEWQETADDTTTTANREVGYVAEQWIGDWHTDDGSTFSWQDIEVTVVQAVEKILAAGGEFRALWVSKFPKRDMLGALVGAGILVHDLNWAGVPLTAAYNNYIALLSAQSVGPLVHERADEQFKYSYISTTDKSVESPQGLSKYLADARVIVTTQAASVAAVEGSGMPIMPVLGDSLLAEHFGDAIPRGPEEAFGDVRRWLGI